MQTVTVSRTYCERESGAVWLKHSYGGIYQRMCSAHRGAMEENDGREQRVLLPIHC